MFFLSSLSMFFDYLYIIPAALIAIIFHEFAHGLVSYLMGDPTPKEDGRLSFNPIKHLDPFGLLCLIIFRVGWAKPVRINAYYYKNKRLGIALVSLAGPFTNIVLAFFSTLLVVICAKYSEIVILDSLSLFFQYGAIINIGLCIFNLIPIPPLDGSKFLASFLPEEVYNQYMKYEKYGFILLILIIIVSDLVSINGNSLFLDLITKVYYGFLVFWLNIFL